MNMPEKRNTHRQLLALLEQHQAHYRVVEHEAVGKCEAVSEIRGTALGQGAKALVCKVKGNGVNQHVLAILAADQQADLSRLAQHIGGSKASLASPAEVDTLTACVFGAIPPFSFHPDLRLIADPLLFDRYPEIAFNAGQLDKSIILNSEDYLRIARPALVAFRRESGEVMAHLHAKLCRCLETRSLVKKSLSIHAITRRVDRLIILARISRHVRYNPVYSARAGRAGFYQP